ncbi:MAG: hypothetical protein RQ966_14930 [Acetobacteraceae bacterium]|nr:hypothetical protein [Acetobacteraceae bacterium]
MPATVSAEIVALIQHVGTVCQICTAIIAVTIGIVTFRYTKRQSALTLINHNNALANLVNKTVIDSPQARDVLGRLQDAIVGYPDDAVIFMYLNYVHNTFRMHEIGAVSSLVWQDTLGSCLAVIGKLRRDQVVRLLGRGYESRFQTAVLARYDECARRKPLEVLSDMRAHVVAHAA